MENKHILETIGNQSKPPYITLKLTTQPNNEGRSQIEILFECLNSLKNMYTGDLLGMAKSDEYNTYDFKRDLCELESVDLIIAELFEAVTKANQQRPDTGFSAN